MFQHKGCDNILDKPCHPYGRVHVGKKYKTAKNMCFRTKTSNARHHDAWGSVAAYFTAAGHNVSLLPVSHCAHSAVVLTFSSCLRLPLLLQYCTSIAEVPLYIYVFFSYEGIFFSWYFMSLWWFMPDRSLMCYSVALIIAHQMAYQTTGHVT